MIDCKKGRLKVNIAKHLVNSIVNAPLYIDRLNKTLLKLITNLLSKILFRQIPFL